ncbi:MAG: DUF3592 domain-containing protein [Wenzhouxiangella sp.]|nr:MAG: DUF3592 domain-containing protein [Wenzhouxiangella sp.]
MGLGLVVDRSRLLLEGRASLDWPSVSGTVVEAAAAPVSGARIGPGWRIRVSYEYEVDGRSFASDRVRLSRRLGEKTEIKAREELVLYEPGEPVPVYYDPDRPARSVLVTGPDKRAWFGLSVGIGLLVIAVLFWVVPTRSNSSPRSGRRSGS